MRCARSLRARQKHAKDVLESRRDLLERGAKALLDKETLFVTDLQVLLAAPTPKVSLVENTVSAA